MCPLGGPRYFPGSFRVPCYITFVWVPCYPRGEFACTKRAKLAMVILTTSLGAGITILLREVLAMTMTVIGGGGTCKVAPTLKVDSHMGVLVFDQTKGSPSCWHVFNFAVLPGFYD